jgi:recombinational DNA repair protein (RecF pathway)
MYQKYTTEGFIVSSRGSKEADMLYLIYTRDFGMVHASATSVRLSKSKLRPHLLSGVKLSLTLLRSKSRWKLVESKQVGNVVASRSGGYKVLAKILLILKTLIHGEEKNESLFEVVDKVYSEALLEQSSYEGVELLGMIKILAALGYGTDKGVGVYVDKEFEVNVFREIVREKKEIVREINKSLKATGF